MGKTALIFPGQGAQKCGMAKDFYENSNAAKEIFDLAEKVLDFDVKKFCFEENEQIHITEYTQACMVTSCLAMFEEMRQRGFAFDVAAGLSLGEYCALAAVGAMEPGEAIRVVRQRGILMQQAVPMEKDPETGGMVSPGAMAAVLALPAEKIEQVIAGLEGVWIANYNCPGQIVISGLRESVETACAALKEAGAKRTVLLNVSGPFHSPLLKEAGEKLYQELEQTSLSEYAIPYITNVTADYVTDKGDIKGLLKEQVYSPVRWQQTVERMLEDGVDAFVEVGPGKTLAAFIKKIDRGASVYNVEKWEDLKLLEERMLA